MLEKTDLLVRLKKYVRSVWFFPSILLILLLLLTTLKISGSSIGIYSMLDGTVAQDTGDIALGPRGVRSDEWLVNTQMTVAQANNDFKMINDNIGEGQDMSLVGDVPYKEWSTAFKPQNIIFFILPLAQAFAFKWWLLGLILIVSCYFLLLELFPRKILRAALLSSIVGLSPMVVWWYQTITILPIAYSFLLILLGLRLLKAKTTPAKLGYSLGLAYVLICFALVLYPPFQIPCLIAVGVFLLGWLLEHHNTRAKIKPALALWPYLLMTFILVAGTGALFYYTRKDVIHTITHTVYPGTRVITSGGVEPLLSLSSFLSPNLEYDEKAASGYLQNQSEASNFILLAPYLFLPSLYLIIREKRRHNKLLWGLILINILLACFFARMYIITPWLDPLYRLLLLDKVPNTRLLLGVGFVGILQLILILKTLDKTVLEKKEQWLVPLLGSLSSLAVMLHVGIYTVRHYPQFIASYPKVFLFAVWIAIAIFLILRKKFTAGFILLLAFSVLSVYRVHPLYRGLGPITTSSPIQAIQSMPDDGNWVVLNDRFIINFPAVAGRDSLNSVQFYPQFKLWHQLDTNKKYDYVYNRYAHIIFSDDPQMTAPLALQYADLFAVKFDPCGTFLQKNAKYVLAEKKLTNSCVVSEKTVSTPAKQYFIYKIVPPTQ